MFQPNSAAMKTVSTRIADIRIDEEHARAICMEIGERLRFAMGDNLPIPQHLSRLIDRLAELDHHESPSIVPSMESASPALSPASKVRALQEA
jgi:hypothetical protein